MRERRIRTAQLVVALAVASSLLSHAALAACTCPGDFELRYVGATTLQIAVAWEAVPNAAGYVVERSPSCDFASGASYNVSSVATVYGDTGKQPADKARFGAPTPWSPSTLASDVVYTYRVRARLPDQSERISNCVEGQLATEPVRGVAGDLWADVVLGQPDFTQNDFGKTTDSATEYAGGVLIDRMHTPNRMYVGDTNHNRVLGFDHVGRCSGIGPGAAVGKSYTKSLVPNSEYPDTGNREFTDGRDATGPTWIDTGSFGSPHWGGTLTEDVDIDLGVPTTFNTASLNSGGANPNYTASSLELFVSDNGSQWTSVGEFDNPNRLFAWVVRFAPVTGRYVRFRVHALSGCIDCDWLFLGEGKVGTTSNIDRNCSVDADCDDDSTCLPDPDLRPQIVIGQPSFTDYGACNGDGTGQIFPARAPATAASLCSMDPFHLTPGETVYAAMMAMDSEGALYVPDLYNHRILKYVDPFATDQIADDVWGQADFAGNRCNRGASSPSADTLCLADAPHAGVAFDSAGSLWVADAGNARVLRFPKLGGSIAHDADVVLGQPSFTTNARGSALNQLQDPLDVTVDPWNGRLYVADVSSGPGSRVVEFRPPFVSGMSAARVLNLSLYCNFDYPENRAMSLAMDTRIHGLWVENSCWFTELFDLGTSPPTPRSRVQVVTNDGIDVNEQGDLFVVGKWNDLHEFKRDGLSTDPQINVPQTVFSGNSPVSSDAMRFGYGVTVLGNQLIAADGNRMLIWNNPATLHTGQAADDVYGQPDFQSQDRRYGYAYPQAYGGQLWVNRGRDNGWHDIQVFDAPLANASTPVTTIPLVSDTPALYPLLGCPGKAYCNCAGHSCSGPNMSAAWADMLDFAPAAGGDEVFVADRWNNRVFRVANLRAQRDANRGPFVDIILGQPDLAKTECNRGAQTPAANTLCYPYDLAFDAAGNLYVADNGGESGSNGRVLEFDAGQLVVALGASTAKLGVAASRVLGTGGDFNASGLQAAGDPLISPFKPGLHPNGALAIGNNPYMTARLGVVYMNPLEEPLPQFALGDMLSYPAGGMFFDEHGDLYVSDTNWSRILIYRQPLALVAVGSPPPTRTPAPTGTPTATPTLAANCTGGVSIGTPSLRIRRNLDPAGDENLELRGRIQLSDPASAIDPIADGFSFAVAGQGGTPLFARSVQPGEAVSRSSLGWRKNRAGTRWTYKDRLGVVPGGIRQVIIGRLRKSGTITFRVYASASNFQVRVDQLPLQLRVVLGGSEQALAGECGTFSFGATVAASRTAPLSCQVKRAGDTVNCH